MIRQLVAGNWKMNGLGASLSELAALKAGLGANACDVLVCLPATLIARATASDGLLIGGQDCSAMDHGAYTGDVSAAMLKDAGASFVILGHSERRRHHGETDADVAAKAKAAWAANLTAVICVGETKAQHAQAAAIVQAQIRASVPSGAASANTVITYEPVWAVGSGKTPTVDEIAAMLGVIRESLISTLGQAGRDIRILYGGSVTPANAAQILGIANLGGVLVGGASLKASDFLGIIAAVKPV